MRLYLDENLSPRAAEALSLLKLDISAAGQPGCPARGMKVPDDVVAQWCRDNGAILVTCDRGRNSPEMIEILGRTRQAVIFVKQDSPTARPLARALLNTWSKIQDLDRDAQSASKQTVIALDVERLGKATRHRHSPIGG